MKQIISLLAFVMLFIPCLHGQTFTLANNYARTAPSGYPLGTPGNDKPGFHLGAESRAGFAITGTGIIIGAVGITIYRKYEGADHGDMSNFRNTKIGSGLWLAGGIVAIMGSVFAIDGGIHDMHSYHKEHRLSISNSDGNQLGLAYNFR